MCRISPSSTTQTSVACCCDVCLSNFGLVWFGSVLAWFDVVGLSFNVSLWPQPRAQKGSRLSEAPPARHALRHCFRGQMPWPGLDPWECLCASQRCAADPVVPMWMPNFVEMFQITLVMRVEFCVPFLLLICIRNVVECTVFEHSVSQIPLFNSLLMTPSGGRRSHPLLCTRPHDSE